ncbi:MAG: ABC transporter ATP-binding protein [Cyanobacteria bacterium REEB459]|nr:ABC transporter ATP-binding protein [Cyanobacteria bacterium REEB459]
MPDVKAPLTPSPELTAAGASGVCLRSVTKRYGGVTAVENLTLDVPAASYTCLLGPSGCGKTTTMRMIAGHEEITAGDILIGNHRVNGLPPTRRNTAMMFQSYALFPHKTVWGNVDFGLKMRQLSLAERRQRVGEMLEILELSHLGDRKPALLSGGQQQRVALARALVTRPQVLLLDEPLSALDENLRIRTRGELRKLQRQFGMTFIQVTHNQDEAYALSDQVVVMDHGRIDQVGSPAEIFSRPLSRFVANFTGDNNLFSGTVTQVTPQAGQAVIELAVHGLGKILCCGDYAQVGAEAACCVRADLIHLSGLAEASSPGLDRALPPLTARITAIEFTGYITRVFLALEKTGQDLLYKARTPDWTKSCFQEGQVVALSWLQRDCVFLAH